MRRGRALAGSSPAGGLRASLPGGGAVVALLKEKRSHRSIASFMMHKEESDPSRQPPDPATLCWGVHEQIISFGERPGNESFSSEVGDWRYEYVRGREVVVVNCGLRAVNCERFAIDQRNRPRLTRTCPTCVLPAVASSDTGNSDAAC